MIKTPLAGVVLASLAFLAAQNPGPARNGKAASAGPSNPFTVVNVATPTGCGGPPPCTATIPSTTSGNVELVFTIHSSSMTDSGGDTYSTGLDVSSGADYPGSFYGVLTAGVTSVTGHWGPYQGQLLMPVEVSGLYNTSIVDTISGPTSGSYGTTENTPAVTTSYANEVIVGVVYNATFGATATSSDCTLMTSNPASYYYVFYKTVGAAGSYSCQYTSSTATSAYVGTIALRTQ